MEDRFFSLDETFYELLRGDNQDEDQYWQALFKNMQILAFDYACAETTARIYKMLKYQGQLIEALEDLIAATALSYQIPLATSNIKHFERVSGLILVKFYS